MVSSKQALNSIFTDINMLKEGVWEPDTDSINATLTMIRVLADNLRIELKDTRDG